MAKEHTMTRYYGTKRTCVMKRKEGNDVTILYIPNDWELSMDKFYDFTIRRLNDDKCFRFTKKLTKVGLNGQRVVINSSYGIKPDEMVVFTVEEMGGIQRTL